MVARAYGSLKSTFNRKRFAILFLSTYIFIAALPILVFGMVINQYLLGQFEDKIRERDLQILRQYESSVENCYNSLERISTLVYMDADLSAYRLSTSPINAMEGIKTLRKYTISYPYIQNIMLYSYLEDRIYTTETALTVDEFFYMYSMDGLTADDLRSLIDNRDSQYISPPTDLKAVLAYKARRISLVALPMPTSTDSKDLKVFFLIDLPSLDSLINTGSQSLMVFTADGEFLTPSMADASFAPFYETIFQAIDPAAANQILSLGSRSYFLQSLESKDTGLRYVSLIDKAAVRAEVDTIRSVMMVVLLILTGVLLIMIIISKQLHLNPLQALFERALRAAGRSPDQPVGYQTVNSAFDYIIDQQATIKTKYDSARNAIREHLLVQLLGNEIACVAEFNELGRDVGLHFSHDSYCVAILHLDSESLRASRHKIADLVESLGEGGECYAWQMPEDRIAAVYCLDNPDNEQLHDYFARVRQALIERGFVVDIGVGNTYPDLSQIAESCTEATSALNYRCAGGGGVLFFRAETGNTDWFDLEYPTKKIQLLEALLLEGDTDKISSTVDEISEFMDKRGLPLSAVRCLSYDIINTLMKTMRVISSKYSPMKEKVPDIMALSGFHSSSDLKNEIQRICVEICAYIRKSNENRIDNLAIRIIDYVNQNYCSTNFSICAMANDLDLSLSLVNTCFKKFMDKTPLEYVNEMRLNLAKHLLATTSLSLNDITHQVGYIDTPSFLRKFHKMTGVTPGQYRRLHTQAAEGEGA